MDSQSVVSLRAAVQDADPFSTGTFGNTFTSSWNGQDVLVRVYRTRQLKISSENETNIRNELETIKKIRRPQLLDVLGSEVTDSDVSIVVPFLKNGNVVDFLCDNPDHNKIQTLYEASQGLHYLHTAGIIHGDVKGVNILVNNERRGVLSDFGVFKIKAQLSDIAAGEFGKRIEMSRDWMSPERLISGVVGKPGDIYSFAMTIIEVFVGDDPLSVLLGFEFIDKVVNHDSRPDRPGDATFSDDLWVLVQRCWNKDPDSRPTAAQVMQGLAQVLGLSPLSKTPDDKSNTETAYSENAFLDQGSTEGVSQDAEMHPILIDPPIVFDDSSFPPYGTTAWDSVQLPSPSMTDLISPSSATRDNPSDFASFEASPYNHTLFSSSLPSDTIGTPSASSEMHLPDDSQAEVNDLITHFEPLSLAIDSTVNVTMSNFDPYPMPSSSTEGHNPELEDGATYARRDERRQFLPLADVAIQVEPRRRLGHRLFVPPSSLATAPFQPRNLKDSI